MSSWCWCSTGWLTESSQLTTSLRLTHDWGGYGLNGGNSSPTGAQFDGNSPLMPSRWRLNLLRAMRCLLRSIKAACMMAAYQSTSHQWGSLALCCCTIYFKSQFHNFHCSASLRVFSHYDRPPKSFRLFIISDGGVESHFQLHAQLVANSGTIVAAKLLPFVIIVGHCVSLKV